MARRGFVFGFTLVLAMASHGIACSLSTSLSGYTGAPAESDGARIDARPSDLDTDDSGARDARGPDIVDLPADPLLGCSAVGLVAYYPMNVTTGTTVTDCGPHHLDGVFAGEAGALGWGTRGGRSALDFNGSGWVTFGIHSELELANGPFTIAAFLRSDEPPTTYFGFPWHFTSSGGYELAMSTDGLLYGQLLVQPGSALIVKLVPTLAAGTWEHVAVVFDPGVGLEVYKNGVSAGRVTEVDGGPFPMGAVQATGRETRIGTVTEGGRWRGGVDELRLFTRALDAAEVARLAAQP